MEGSAMTPHSGALSRTVYTVYEKSLLSEVKRGPIPTHIAIIMDGNRRFAEVRDLHFRKIDLLRAIRCYQRRETML